MHKQIMFEVDITSSGRVWVSWGGQLTLAFKFLISNWNGSTSRTEKSCTEWGRLAILQN